MRALLLCSSRQCVFEPQLASIKRELEEERKAKQAVVRACVCLCFCVFVCGIADAALLCYECRRVTWQLVTWRCARTRCCHQFGYVALQLGGREFNCVCVFVCLFLQLENTQRELRTACDACCSIVMLFLRCCADHCVMVYLWFSEVVGARVVACFCTHSDDVSPVCLFVCLLEWLVCWMRCCCPLLLQNDQQKHQVDEVRAFCVSVGGCGVICGLFAGAVNV